MIPNDDAHVIELPLFTPQEQRIYLEMSRRVGCNAYEAAMHAISLSCLFDPAYKRLALQTLGHALDERYTADS